MSNRIIKIGDTSDKVQTLQSKEVYVDISMNSLKNTSEVQKYVSKKDGSTENKYKISTNINVKAIQDSLNNIFNWIPGERVILPEFGSKLRKYLYEGITDYNTEQIISEIHRSVTEWEPRIKIAEVVNATTVEDKEDNIVHLEIIYTIPGLSSDELFSYGIEQSTSY